MKILFVHQNFPAQFKHLAPALARAGHDVTALTPRPVQAGTWRGVRVLRYEIKRGTTPAVHPWVADFETKAIRGEACFRAALGLKNRGYEPDVIVAHPGWGESLFLKEVWPRARLGIYCEFFYQAQGADTGFDPEFPSTDVGDACRLRIKNVNSLLHFDLADAGISPTHWQASTFPEPFRNRITVAHDGIDTVALAPDIRARVRLGTGSGAAIELARSDEVITFVNRNLEPYRGYHVFMRELPEILRRRPDARVVIVGGDDVSYGAKPDPSRYGGRSWKQVYIDEVRARITDSDWERVHFVGNLPYQQFVPLLQISSVHVYLTYPFVLSWSLLEAMSVGCAIVASDTAPLREAIVHGETGRLVDFFDHQALAGEVCELLEAEGERLRLGANARCFAQQHYDLESHCLPLQMRWVEELAR